MPDNDNKVVQFPKVRREPPGRFNRFAPEPRAEIPPGYEAPLDTRTTHELIRERREGKGLKD